MLLEDAMKKIFLLIIILVLLTISLFIFIPSYFSSNQQEAKVTKKIDTIELDISNVKTKVITNNKDKVEAKLKGHGNIHVSKKGDTIEVEYRRPWFRFFNIFNRTELTISISENFNNDLVLHIGSGNINFTNMKQMDLNKLDIDLGSGHIDFTNIEKIKLNSLSIDVGSGNTDFTNVGEMDIKELDIDVGSGNLSFNSIQSVNSQIDISSGNIQIHALHNKKLNLDLSSGNVHIKHYIGKLEADMSSGDLFVGIDELVDDFNATVNSGLITLQLPKDSDFSMKGNVSSGRIVNNFPFDQEERSGKTLKGVHGSGTHKVHLQASSGVIVIE